ncbi:MAG: 50S ribosomal protein L11 methyltransferase, partial [Pseudomonadota bacterium]
MTDTYGDLITRGAEALKAAGIDAQRREARLLLCEAAALSTTDLIAREQDLVHDGGVRARYQAMLTRRCAHEPFAHIVGRRPFYGLELKSDARALVPRPESETVVDEALKRMPQGRGVTVADLGTGSGCLLIAILTEREGARGIAIDADPAAATLARENFER